VSTCHSGVLDPKPRLASWPVWCSQMAIVVDCQLPNRLSSYSGGHVLVVGAIDRRVKCVVAQVPLASGHSNARRLIRADYLAGVQKLFEDDRRARMAGGAPGMIPVVAEDPAAPSALLTPDSWAWFTETGKPRAASWKNEVTLRSVEMFTEYEPGSYASFISPTPLLMVVALGDVLTVADLALAAYETRPRTKAPRDPLRRALRRVCQRLRFRFEAGSRVVQSAPRVEVAIPTFMDASQGRRRFSASSTANDTAAPGETRAALRGPPAHLRLPPPSRCRFATVDRIMTDLDCLPLTSSSSRSQIKCAGE
jgi:hypothetical protein